MKLLGTYTARSNQLSADLSGKFSHKGPLLFLMRHGQIEGHGHRRFIGSTDIPLDTAGREQARSWQAPLASICFGQIYTSALSRCRETAALACPGRRPVVDPRLNEIHLGDWEALTFDHIKTCHPDQFEQRGKNIYGFSPPGGESFRDLFHRAAPFFRDLKLTSPTLVVTHAGVIRAMRCFWAGDRMENLLTHKTGYGQLCLLAPA